VWVMGCDAMTRLGARAEPGLGTNEEKRLMVGKEGNLAGEML
jgi:hypothetical protein